MQPFILKRTVLFIVTMRVRFRLYIVVFSSTISNTPAFIVLFYIYIKNIYIHLHPLFSSLYNYKHNSYQILIPRFNEPYDI